MTIRKILGTQYDDTILVTPATVTITTSSTKAKKPASEVFDVSDFSTAVFAGDGKDKVYIVGTSIDAVDGGTGDDLIYGGMGDDLLSGGAGKDSIYGGSGNDIIGAVRPGTVALTTTDYLIDQNADQIGDLLVGDGFDPVLSGNQVVLSVSAVGNDIIVGGNGKDTIWGDNGPGTNAADTAVGGADQIFGGNSDDSIYGQGGNDVIRGENGNDIIDGGTGDDIIDGGLGADKIKGGAGADYFVYNSALDSTTLAMDIIADFSRASLDKIDLRPLLGASDLEWGGNAGKAFGVWQLVSGANTLIMVDTTGDALADMVIQLNGIYALKNADFLGVRNTAPTLQPVAGITYNDTDGNDTFGESSGNLVGADSDVNDIVTYKLAGSSASVEPGFDIQKATPYGIFYLNTDSGAYKFVADDGAIEMLKTTQTVEMVVRANDGIADSLPQTITLSFNGVNDSPVGTASKLLPDGKENTPYTLSASDLLQGFTDLDGDALSVANLTVDHGALKSTGIGVWSLIPESNYSGPVALSYEVIDGYGGAVNGSQSLSLAPLLVFEFKVNTTTAGDQFGATITALADGGWVTGWSSMSQDGSIWGVYQQRFTADGRADGGEVQINTTTENSQEYLACTGLTDGGWVMTWISYGQDGSGYGIYQQRYDASGSAIGGEVQVNATSLSDQSYPAITALADGGWVTIWNSYGQDGSGYGIYQQRYDTNGSAIGGEVQVNATSSYDQFYPAITALADGGWVTSWISYGQDGSGYGVYQQRYDTNGSAIGGEVLANTTTASHQFYPAIAALADGGWVTIWNSYGQDGSGYGIYQQRYDANGSTIGGEVRVNSTTFSDQYDPAITALTDGGWVATWSSFGQDGSAYGVYQQRYAANGSAMGGEMQVNTTTFRDQINPTITALADGGWVTSWNSNTQDGSDFGIYQQRYDANGSPMGLHLEGNAFANSLVWTGSGAVALDGGGGNDVLKGGAGNDRLMGGSGNDTLFGLGGSDTFVFMASDGPGIDSIQGFSSAIPVSGGDILDVSDLLIGYAPNVSTMSDFVQSHESAGSTIVSVDRDGSGLAYASEDIMTLVGVTGMDLNNLLAQGNLVLS